MSLKLTEYKVFLYDVVDSELPEETKCFSIKRKSFWGLVWVEIDKAYGPISEVEVLVEKLEELKQSSFASVDISEIREYLKDHITLAPNSIYL